MLSSKPNPGNSLADTHPELAAQANGWDPRTITRGMGKKLEWVCNLGHNWRAAPNTRTNMKTNCPVCANKKVLSGTNDLATTDPDLAREAFGWDPHTVFANSHKKMLWLCTNGHEYSARLYNRKNGRGCPYCANKKVLPGFNDFETRYPELAKEALEWDPSTELAGSAKKFLFRCSKNHEYRASLDARIHKKSGCPYCVNQKLLVGFNDLATTHPEIAKEAVGWDPKTVIGSKKSRLWRCPFGHEYFSSAENRMRAKSGCPYCVNQKLFVGFNDLATTHPEISKQAVGWDPKTVVAGSSKKRRWHCDNGHEWITEIRNITNHKSWCPTCAKYGFDPNKDAWLYFIEHDEWKMFQVGITNYPDNRLNQHKRIGWAILEIRGPMSGHLTRQLETDCLHALEKRGAILGHKARIEKFDGYSEAWTSASLKVTSIKQILDWVYEDDNLLVIEKSDV